MAVTNLLDIQKLNGNDPVVGLVEEGIKRVPELSIFPMRTIKGTSFTTGVRTGRPTVSFRTANDGVTPSKSTFEKRLVECFIATGLVEVDLAVSQAYEDGAAAWEMIEAQGVVQGALETMASQIWYGTSADALGFGGLKAFTPKSDTTKCYPCTGTTSVTQSSVYLVRFGPQLIQLVAGNGASLNLGPFMDVILTNSTSGKKYPGRTAVLNGWFGLAINSFESVVRICNVGGPAETDVGDTLTDKILYNALALFPSNVMPDAIFMSRRSRTELQNSRTVTLFGQGRVRADQPGVAVTPSEFEGVPIYATDAILNTDAVES